MSIERIFKPTVRKDGSGWIVEFCGKSVEQLDGGMVASHIGGLIYIVPHRGTRIGVETARMDPGAFNRNEEWAVQAGAESLTESQTIIAELRAALRDVLGFVDVSDVRYLYWTQRKGEGSAVNAAITRARRALGGA